MSETSATVDFLAPLLQALGSGQIPQISQLLSQFGVQADDPRIGMVMRLLEARQAPPPESVTIDGHAEPDELPVEMISLRDHQERVRELSDVAKTMFAELNDLRERNDTLAAALGACFLCFGKDGACVECGGVGAPGWRAPEPVAYRAYVVPALRRVRAIQTTAQTQGGALPRPTPPTGFPFSPVTATHFEQQGSGT
jgi:hypothetical protein